jgi:hypothetical protein
MRKTGSDSIRVVGARENNLKDVHSASRRTVPLYVKP